MFQLQKNIYSFALTVRKDFFIVKISLNARMSAANDADAMCAFHPIKRGICDSLCCFDIIK
ncbi:MAG: hypothetical protein C6P36_15800 [Geobacillus sp.]|nr:MAG: hypothetical protein C6P36_15800 [Geobacillus sp.]